MCHTESVIRMCMKPKKLTKHETNLLLYNAHLFGDNPSWGNALTNFVTGRPQKHFDNERLSALVITLRTFGQGGKAPDVIGLCEIWDNRYASFIDRNLKALYQYSYRPRIKPGTSRERIVLGPGLMLLTKLRIIQKSWTPFHNTNSLDSLSQKGFLHVRLAANKKRRVNVILTHLQSGMTKEDIDTRLLQLGQLREFIEKRLSVTNDVPTIIMGDLNIIAENEDGLATEEYSRAITILPAIDVFRSVHPDAQNDPGYTSDAQTNHLLNIFHGDTHRRKRLDFFLSIDPRKTMRWTNCNVKKLPMKLPSNKRVTTSGVWPKYISDHFALVAKFVFSANAK